MGDEKKKPASKGKALARRTTTPSGIERVAEMQPWMERYALWLASEPEAELARPKGEGGKRGHAVPVAERIIKARAFSGRPMDKDKIRLLEQRPDVREFFEKVRTDAQFHAKELATRLIAQKFEARELGLQKALDKQIDPVTGKAFAGPEADVKAIEHYTRPAWELAFPKKANEGAVPPPRIIINLAGMSDERKKLWLSGITEPEEPDDVEWEIIASPKDTDGDND